MGIFDSYSELTGEEVKKKEKGAGVFSKLKTGAIKAKEKASSVKNPYTSLTKEAEAVEKQKEVRVAKKEEVKKAAPATYEHTELKKFEKKPLVKLFLMIKKDFKLIIRTKSSALVILLGPLLVILLVGLAFNSSSLYNIKVGAYSDSYSDLTNSISAGLEEQNYVIIHTESSEDCIEGVKLGDYQVCTIFPPDMSIDNAKDNTIEIYVDESRLNIAHLVSNTLKTVVLSKSKEISESLAGVIVSTLENAKQEIISKEATIIQVTSLNDQAVSQLGEVVSDLSTIGEAGISSFNFSEFDDEIEGIKKQGNISSARFKGLEELIDALKIKMDDVALKTSGATSTLSSAQTSLQSSQSQLSDLKNSLINIRGSIESIQITDPNTIVSPINTAVTPVAENETFLGFLFPTLVVLILMYMGILLSAALVIREKESRSYFRNFITPTSDFLFMIGTFFTNLILILFQLVILLLVALYFFPSGFLNTLGLALLLLLIASSVFILLGMFIGYLFKSGETSTLGAIAVASIMLLFSNTILPIETLPGTFAKVAAFNPFVMTEAALKKIILFSSGIGVIAETLYILIGFAVILFFLAFAAREVTKRRLT